MVLIRMGKIGFMIMYLVKSSVTLLKEKQVKRIKSLENVRTPYMIFNQKHDKSKKIM